jgi:hypothetical protein
VTTGWRASSILHLRPKKERIRWKKGRKIIVRDEDERNVAEQRI